MTFGAWADGELLGLATIAREERPRLRHRAGLYGVGVLAAAQGRGAGRQLVGAAVAYARELPGVTSVHLVVTETQHAARRLYESLGFQYWGSEPEGLRVDGKLIRAAMYWLDLTGRAPKQSER